MKVLVDTSVWVGHFKQRDEQLVVLLEAGVVACHPYVVVEVACGTPPRRREVIDMLGELESVPVTTTDELLELLQRRALFGRGCGFVDVSLLASALLSEQTLLWTLDKRLEAVATELGRNYRPALAS
jgi:predicted nucleic acid-binding protein